MCTYTKAYVTFTFSPKHFLLLYVSESETWESIFSFSFTSSSAGQVIVQVPICRHGHELPLHLAKAWDQSLAWLLASTRLTVHLSALLLSQLWEVQREKEDGGSWLWGEPHRWFTDACPWLAPFLLLPATDRGGWWGGRCGEKLSCC